MVLIPAKGFDHIRTVSGPPTEILDQIPTPIWRAGSDFLCDYVNRAWLNFTGGTLDQELGRGWLESVHPDDRDRALAVVFDGFHKRVPFTVEFRVRRYDGMYRWVVSTGDVSVDPDGSFSGYIGSCFDIHERKQAEEELRQAKEHIDAVVSNAPITIFVVDREGVFTLSEGAGLKAVGLKPGENVGVSALDLYASLPVIEQTGNVTTGGDMIRRVLAGETITGITELRGRYFENRFVPFRGADGDVIGLVGVATDVTARRQAEAALAEDRSRLQSLSRRLVEAQETERRHVARELHDEIGQTLTAVKIAIQSLCLEPALDNFSDRIGETVAVVDSALERIRDLSMALRPAMLDDLGLVPTLHWYFDSVMRRCGIDCEYIFRGAEKRLGPDLETTCFRIAQEALTNILRHACATQVRLMLSVAARRVELMIFDNGRGFNAPVARRNAARGVTTGLSTMHERALLIGGSLSIISRKGEGSTIRARFPLSRP